MILRPKPLSPSPARTASKERATHRTPPGTSVKAPCREQLRRLNEHPERGLG